MGICIELDDKRIPFHDWNARVKSVLGLRYGLIALIKMQVPMKMMMMISRLRQRQQVDRDNRLKIGALPDNS